MDHVVWTTSREVHRIALRAGRFIKVGPRAGRFVEASYILGPWSSNCLVIWMCVAYEVLSETLRMNFVVPFPEWWLRMVSLELWLGMTSLKLWLGMWMDTSNP